MSRRDVIYRLAGLALIGGALLSSLAHKAVAARGGPPNLAELALAIASFLLASVGMMLLINGARLFEHRYRPADARRDG